MAKKSSKKAAPPLPTEAPPLPDEQPPLPDEQPPLPNEAPPLPNEAPPLPNEQPPPPNEQPPLPDETAAPPLPDEPAAEPLTQLGDDSEDEGDDQGEDKDEGKKDEGEGKKDESKGKGKGKEKAKAKEKEKEGKEGKTPDPGAWQAVWAPEQNAYYFWNKDTGEVTWTNPLAPPPAADAPPLPNEPAPAPSTSRRPATIPDIDPALHHLLGPEQRDGATLNSLKFAPQDYNYSFTHLDEYNRAKRFSEHYFDVDAWEKQKAAEAYKRKAEEEAGIVQQKKITKRDMDRFRAKKAEQKQRRQAWLYD